MPKMDNGTVKKQPPKPRLVNRGAAGLLTKLGKPATAPVQEPEKVEAANGKMNNIAPSLKVLAVAIDGLTHDPNNARLHPERNMSAIELSLATYGQVKPVVVRRKGMVVMAGNGTLQAAKNLGWTKIAASVVDMSEAEAAGFGLADNRSAELAAWDFEVVARLERLVAEDGGVMVGWSTDELMTLRGSAGAFVEPPADFPEVDENIEVEHECPKCGYRFSGGSIHEVGQDDDAGGP